MVKVLLNIGPLSTYETLLKNDEDIITDRAMLTRVTRRRDAEREADKQIAIDEHMRQLEEDLGKKANQHVADHMEAILDVALADWSSRVKAQLTGQVPRPRGPRAGQGQAQPGPAGGRGATGATGRNSATAQGGAFSPYHWPTATAESHGLATPGWRQREPPTAAMPGRAQWGQRDQRQGQAPTVTYLTSPANGYSLPDDEDGDLL